MKAPTAIGIVIATVGLLGGSMMEGTSPAAFINIPAILIVLGGTLGVCTASSGMEAMKNLPALYKKAFAGEQLALGDKVVELVRYADRARRDGLLALEEEIESIDDEYLKKGVQRAAAAPDPHLARDTLDGERGGMQPRHKHAVEP